LFGLLLWNSRHCSFCGVYFVVRLKCAVGNSRLSSFVPFQRLPAEEVLREEEQRKDEGFHLHLFGFGINKCTHVAAPFSTFFSHLALCTHIHPFHFDCPIFVATFPDCGTSFWPKIERYTVSVEEEA